MNAGAEKVKDFLRLVRESAIERPNYGKPADGSECGRFRAGAEKVEGFFVA